MEKFSIKKLLEIWNGPRSMGKGSKSWIYGCGCQNKAQVGDLEALCQRLEGSSLIGGLEAIEEVAR